MYLQVLLARYGNYLDISKIYKVNMCWGSLMADGKTV